MIKAVQKEFSLKENQSVSIHSSELDVMDNNFLPPKIVQFLFHEDSD